MRTQFPTTPKLDRNHFVVEPTPAVRVVVVVVGVDVEPTSSVDVGDGDATPAAAAVVVADLRWLVPELRGEGRPKRLLVLEGL